MQFLAPPPKYELSSRLSQSAVEPKRSEVESLP